MKLVFKKLIIHNFMSFKDEIIDFDDYRGMTRIMGRNLDIPGLKNGLGKTMIPNSLVYGLFGELPFKLKNENIANRYLTDKNTFVTVIFDSARKHYKITSGIKKKQSYCELYSIDDHGKESNITKSTIAETRMFMEREILHCDMPLFMRTIFLNSDPNFNFYNLKHADRKDFIDKLFDISIFGEIYNFIHRDCLTVEKEITRLQGNLMVLNNNRQEYNTKLAEFDKKKNENLLEMNERLKKLREDLEHKKEHEVKKNTEQLEKCSTEITELEKGINEINASIQKNDYDASAMSNEIQRYKGAISDRQKIIDKHQTVKNKLCDDCKDIFSKHYKLDTYENEIVKLNSKIAEINTKKETILRDSDQKKSTIRELNSKINDLSRTYRSLNEEYERSQNEIRRCELGVNSLETQIENTKIKTNPYIELITENDKKIKTLSEEILQKDDDYNHIKYLESTVSQDNLKKFIIKDLIGVLNNKIKYYLHKLGANYDVVFDEEMKYDFVTSAKDGVEFNNFSKGEQARISIATCFAFRDFLSRRSNISSNIFILDEFFDSNVDSVAIENTVDILKDFVKNNKQKIFIISHRTEISDDIFNNIIMVEKKDNISSIKNSTI